MEDMSDEEFYKSLIELHRPVKEKDTFGYRTDQYMIRCNGCDNNVYKIWREGDPEVMCDYWKEHLRRGGV